MPTMRSALAARTGMMTPSATPFLIPSNISSVESSSPSRYFSRSVSSLSAMASKSCILASSTSSSMPSGISCFCSPSTKAVPVRSP
jgi:hypothetical protein